VADVYDALSAERPYRGALSPPEVFSIMDRDGARGFCPDCYDALQCVARDGYVADSDSADEFGDSGEAKAA
jgi:HD-GYP domain-containing protein (c-di-GMP phosphodiesterase class II)